MTGTHHLALIPRDGLFCKDGRGWHTSSSGRGHALDWPWPTTVRGALTTAFGRAHEAGGANLCRAQWLAMKQSVVVGRSLVLRRPHAGPDERKVRPWQGTDRLWRVPADALWLEGAGTVHRLQPHKPLLPTLGRDDDPAREALWVPTVDDQSKPLPTPLWWGEEPFVKWLLGEQVFANTEKSPHYGSTTRVQAHVGIDAGTFAAADGILYAHDVLETLDRGGQWAIGIECTGPALGLDIVTLGSDGRVARAECLPPALFNMPKGLTDRTDQIVKRVKQKRAAPLTRLRIVVVTPAVFAGGWLPDFLARSADGQSYHGALPGLDVPIRLCAAFAGRPEHVSGWDMQAGPKPTLRLVPSGSVYFVERTDGESFTADEVSKLWLAPVGLCRDDGFGRIVPGLWIDEQGTNR